MEDRAPINSASSDQSSTSISALTQPQHHHEGRGAWVLTCYGVCGLALFGVLAYFFSDFVAH